MVGLQSSPVPPHAKKGLVQSDLVYRTAVFIGAENHLLFVSSGGAVMNQSQSKFTNTETPQ